MIFAGIFTTSAGNFLNNNLTNKKRRKKMAGGFDKFRHKTYDDSKGRGNPRKWRAAFNSRISPEEAREIVQAQAKTPHELLEVSEYATMEEIRLAFRRLMKVWHPDLNPHRYEEATEMSKLIISAYQILTS
jgi:DnaJ-class molecular chaperone